MSQAEPGSRALLEGLLARALQAVHAGHAVQRSLSVVDGELRVAGRPLAPGSGVWIVAIGKAAAAMARAAEEWAGERLRGGLVVTKDGHGAPAPARLPLRECSHPLPDARGEAAARELLAQVSSLRTGDTLLVLLSGGTSALTSCPAPGLELADLSAVTRALLGCPADIEQLNAVRKHLSCIAGGRLTAAAGCDRIDVLAVSDVPGDRLDVIGSGPCEADPSSYQDALRVLERFELLDRVPARVVAHLERGCSGGLAETPKPGDPALARVRSQIVARNADARAAMALAAREHGLVPVMLGEILSGEARDLGQRLAAMGRAARPGRPSLLIAGGESVVTLRGRGRGGRSQELALAAALELARGGQGGPGTAVELLAVGTDGTDGPTPAAGAWVDSGSVQRGRLMGVDAAAALADNDAYEFFLAEGGLIETGPTSTHVMDLVLVWVGAS